MVVVVPTLLDGMRVDRAVALLAEISRGRAAQLVASGRVRVDDVPVTSRSTPLVSGSVLRVTLPPEGTTVLVADADVVFAVVHHDEQIIVVDKPAGLIVHPGAGRTEGTLASGLLARFPDLAGLSGVCDPSRPGLVHRLDRGTSGLLVVARTEGAYRSLVSQFGARTVARRYLGLVAGHVAEERGVVDAPIGRSARTPTQMAVSAQGRSARTRYTVLRRYSALPGFGGEFPASLLCLTLDTGRTHQIRVHLSAIGHPVVGDDRYGRPAPAGGAGRAPGSSRGRPAVPRRSDHAPGTSLEPGRLFLHAAELGFVHPGTGQPVRWVSPLAADLAGLLGESPSLPQ